MYIFYSLLFITAEKVTLKETVYVYYEKCCIYGVPFFQEEKIHATNYRIIKNIKFYKYIWLDLTEIIPHEINCPGLLTLWFGLAFVQNLNLITNTWRDFICRLLGENRIQEMPGHLNFENSFVQIQN